AQLALDARLGRLGIDGRHPVLSLSRRLQRGRTVEARHRVDAAHELRRGDDLQVVAAAEGDDLVRADKLLGIFDVGPRDFEELIALRMFVADLFSTALMMRFWRSSAGRLA